MDKNIKYPTTTVTIVLPKEKEVPFSKALVQKFPHRATRHCPVNLTPRGKDGVTIMGDR